MDSTGRFLLGGALGAALGYLLSQKNVEKTLQPGQEPALAAAPAVPLAGGGFQSVAPVEPPVASAAVPLAPPAPAPQQPPAAEPAPVRSPAASVLDWTIPAAPPADWRPEPEPAPAVPAPVFPAEPLTPSVPTLHMDAPAVAEPAESEVILTREFLEEPLPGSGWRSTTPLAVEDETAEDETAESVVYLAPASEMSPVGPEVARPSAPVERAPSFALPTEQATEGMVAELQVVEEMEIQAVEESAELPVVEETFTDTMGPGTAGTEALAQAASVAGRLPVVDSQPAGDSSRVDDLKSRIEETRRRIRHELEQPFDISTPARSLDRDWTTAPVVPVVERTIAPVPPVMEPVVVAQPAMETSATEPVMLDAPPMESVEVETLPIESMVMEPVGIEPHVAEQSAVEQLVPEPAAAEPVFTAPAPLESQPVVPVFEEPVAVEPLPMESVVAESLPLDSVPAAPAMSEPIAFAPIATQAVSAEPAVAEPVAAQAAIPVDVSGPVVELEVDTPDSDASVDLGLEEPVDYDSMKNRIESTRSRLKAKAFDAMMTGESSLLGRDLEGSSRASTKATGVDSDIDETIETSLREEEE